MDTHLDRLDATTAEVNQHLARIEGAISGALAASKTGGAVIGALITAGIGGAVTLLLTVFKH